MAMTGGIGYEIDQLAELGVPELMRRQQVDPQLKYALALQEATKMVEAAARERDMAQPMPSPANVVGQMETSLAKRLAPGVQQQGRRSTQMRNRAAMGLPGQAAPNLARMAMGGIVGYQEGGDVEGKSMQGDQSQRRAPYLDPALEKFLVELEALNEQKDAAFPQEKDLFEQKIQDLISTTSPRVKRLASESSFGLPKKSGMAMGGVVGYQEGGSVDVDALLDSLMMAESGGNPRAVSSAGAEGAYQIMPTTAADPGFGVSPMEGSRFDPEASRKFAKQYLQAMIDRYDGDMEAALVAYNAGPGNADKFVAAGKDYDVLPQAMQTKPYVERVMGQISPRRSYERAPEGGLSTLALDPVKPRRLEPPAPVKVRDTSEDVASMLESIDPAAAPKEADMMRTVSKRDAEKQRAIRDLQAVGRAQDSQRDREAAGGLSYIKALADAEAAQKANALRYLQQAGKFQEMQGDTADMLAALDPAAEGVKGFAGPDGSLVESEEELSPGLLASRRTAGNILDLFTGLTEGQQRAQEKREDFNRIVQAGNEVIAQGGDAEEVRAARAAARKEVELEEALEVAEGLDKPTVPTRQQAFSEMFPEALSAAQRFEVRKGLGTEVYPEGAPLKDAPKKGLAGLLSRIDMSKVADVAEVLGRGAGASKGFEAAKIVEESAKARAIQQARQDQLDKLREQLEVEREKIGATRTAAQTRAEAQLRANLVKELSDYESSPAYQRDVQSRIDAGESPQEAAKNVIGLKRNELLRDLTVGGMGGLDAQSGLSAEQRDSLTAFLAS